MSQKQSNILKRGVYNADLRFLTFFQVTGNLANCSDSFLSDEYVYQSHVFLERPASLKFYVKNLNRIINLVQPSRNILAMYHFLMVIGEPNQVDSLEFFFRFEPPLVRISES